jgi:hypothetical protein
MVMTLHFALYGLQCGDSSDDVWLYIYDVWNMHYGVARQGGLWVSVIVLSMLLPGNVPTQL